MTIQFSLFPVETEKNVASVKIPVRSSETDSAQISQLFSSRSVVCMIVNFLMKALFVSQLSLNGLQTFTGDAQLCFYCYLDLKISCQLSVSQSYLNCQSRLLSSKRFFESRKPNYNTNKSHTMPTKRSQQESSFPVLRKFLETHILPMKTADFLIFFMID